MKKFTSIFLVVFYMTSLVVPLLPYLEYSAYYDVIVNEYCVEKDKPESDCNGKCYLKKKISKFNLDKSVTLDFLFLSTFSTIESDTDFILCTLTRYILPEIIKPEEYTPKKILAPPQFTV